MRKLIPKITIVLIILISQPIFAKPVDIQDAKRVAVNFYYERVNQHETIAYKEIKVHSHKTHKQAGKALYYTFFMKPGGFVVISSDDRVQPVLAYSFKGNFYHSDIPPAYIARMNIFAKQISYVIDNKLESNESIRQAWKHLSTKDISTLKPLTKKSKAVPPLLSCTWNQSIYYNGACPDDPAGPGGHALAGCVATCIGQIMYYYRWPETGTGSYTYVHPVYDTITADFGNTTYRWDEMTDNITSDNSAIAELLFHIGVSVDMNYGPNGSGMYNHKAGYIYRTYFKYVPETHYIFRDSTTIDWDSILTHHLDRKMPLYYAGWTADSLVNISGHAFVCDGYQDTSYFHFNWGWSGSYDGYFYLGNLNPGASGFNYGNEVVANIYPDTNLYTFPSYCSGLITLTNKEGTIEDGSGPIDEYQDNTDCMWLIAPQDPEFDSITKIKLKFKRFDIENNADSIIVYDGSTINDPILGSYSGNILPPTITSSSDKMLVRFISNNAIGANGWMASYESVFPVYCGNEVLTTYHDTISDGSGTKRYSNNSMCNWYINPPDAPRLTLYFTEFETEQDKDYLSIYDPSTVPSTLLAKYSGNGLPPSVTSNSGKMFIAFFTNETINAPGWTAYYDTLETIGITERINFSDLSIYPNPGNDIVNINFSLEQKQEITLTLIDFSGKLVYKEVIQATPGLNNNSIITTNFAPGVYTLRITELRGLLNRKLIIR